MSRVVSDVGQPLDQFGHPRQRPEVGREALRARTRSKRALHGHQLRRVQLRLPARTTGTFETVSPVRLPGVEPVVGTDPGHSQRFRHRHLRFATREQPRGLQPTRLHRGKIPCGCGHASACDRTRKIR